MKFCSNCGMQLFDDAAVCVRCGCPVSGQPQYQQPQYQQPQYQMPQYQQPQPNGAFVPNQPQANVVDPVQPCLDKKEPAVVVVFNFLSNIFLALTVFFLFTSIFYAGFDTDISSSYYSGKYYLYTNMYLDKGSAIVFLISSIAAFAMGLVTFIVTLAKRQKGTAKFRGISKLIFGIMAVVLAIMAHLT